MRHFNSRAEYRRAWSESSYKDHPVPLNLDIELASVCNLECPFCFVADKKFDDFIRQGAADGKPRARLMPTELAMNLIDEAAGLGIPALKFNWRGESTLHPDYSKILKRASDLVVVDKYWTRGELIAVREPHNTQDQYKREVFFDRLVNTNANCKDEAIDGLMAATKVMVSHDSLDPEIYPLMRAGGNLHRVIEVVKELVRRKHPNLWVRRVITDQNRDERFFERVRLIYGDTVRVSQHFCFDRNAAEHHQLWDPVQQKYLDAAVYERTYCSYPSQRIVVSASGLAFPCCLDLKETLPVGDVRHQSLADIWNGEPMKKIRGQLRANALDGLAPTAACHKCESWMAYKAPQRAYVGDVEITSPEQEAEQLDAVLGQAK